MAPKDAMKGRFKFRKEWRLPVGQQPKLWRLAKGVVVVLSQHAEVTLVIRSRGSEDEWRKLVAKLSSGLPRERRYLTRAELARKWGASPRDIAAVRKFAVEQGLKVVSADAARRCVVVSGSLFALGRAFVVDFLAVKHPLGTFRSHRNAPSVPEAIHPMIECVLGLDNLPTAEAHAASAAGRPAMNRWQAVLDAYDIPPKLSGKGQCVAIIVLGGGYYQSDLDDYFAQFKLPPPRMITRSIGGVKNLPASKELIDKFFDGHKIEDRADRMSVLWTYETVTDVAMVGTVAPKASILLVQTSNDDQGEYHALTSIITDRKNKPSALSCSWGGREPWKSRTFMLAMDRWFQAAAVLGMTVCCSSGDRGEDMVEKKCVVKFPASSPHVLTCGGTTLDPNAGTEVAWYQKKPGGVMASGGGFSEFFSLPPWQQAAGINVLGWIPKGTRSGKGRAIPDVAARANLEEGYTIIIAGRQQPTGGTSAAAPLWAALAALLNEGLKTRIGSLHTLLYDGTLSRGLRDIVEGKTGVFHTRKGWDACTGWGSPRGRALLRVLRG